MKAAVGLWKLSEDNKSFWLWKCHTLKKSIKLQRVVILGHSGAASPHRVLIADIKSHCHNNGYITSMSQPYEVLYYLRWNISVYCHWHGCRSHMNEPHLSLCWLRYWITTRVHIRVHVCTQYIDWVTSKVVDEKDCFNSNVIFTSILLCWTGTVKC